MLIFPKPFEVPDPHVVWTFPRALAFHVCNHVSKSIPRVGPESLSRMMLLLKYLVKAYFDSFEVPVLYLVGTFP